MSYDPFFQGGKFGNNTAMTFSPGLTCTLNMPKARASRFSHGVEEEQSLPEYNPRSAFLVDDYPAAPPQWERSTNGMLSYTTPVKAEHGLWLDFNGCWQHTHDVAVIVSAQGINALTYVKTDQLRLEQYRERCPKHNEAFTGANRRCQSCGFDWPPQNYLATTGTPQGLFWLDGFRMPDGAVRQYVFTEDESRSVAKAVIGAERVHAIGILFFLSKNPKPQPVYQPRRGGGGYSYGGEVLESLNYGNSKGMLGGPSLESLSASPTRGGLRSASVQPKRYELAAGAKIKQHVYLDPKDPDYWSDTPAGMIIINYADEESVLRIVEAGRVNRSEGVLGNLGIPVGHQPS